MRFMISMTALAVLAGPTVAQDHPVQPTKYHELLKQFEGSWTAKAKFMMVPGEPMVESQASETAKLSLNGLWLIMDYKGDMMGQKYSGHGVMSYDERKQKYAGNWVDSMSGSFKLTEGTCDAARRKFMMIYKGLDPASGKPMKMKQISEILNENKKRPIFRVVQPNGEDLTVGVIEYTRRASKKAGNPKPPTKPQ